MSSSAHLQDQQSRDRIIDDLDRNMLVEAGAGSGKTYMMAARMASGIARGSYEIEHMAAVTFTRKAAAELRGRFQLALEERLAGTVDPAGAARVRSALSNLERFFAGTIHSFCAHLLRERPVEAGLSPGFLELDDVEDLMRRRQSWRDYRTEAKAAGDPDILALLEAGLEPKHLDDAFAKVCTHAEVDFSGGGAPCPDPATAWTALDAFWDRLQKKKVKPIAIDTTCSTQKAMRVFERRQRVADQDYRRARALVELLDIWDFKPGITQNRWADDAATKKRLAQEITDLHTDFRTAVVEPFLLAWRQYVYRLSMTVLMKARQKAAADRHRDNTLNYGDLLQLTARLLRSHVDVRHALQARYRWIFVDEFQDTDPVQAEIIFWLSGERPGSLFVVGDPKQSIYRFTRADIDIYNRARKRLEDEGAVVLPLTTNFRSVPTLCDWANGVFKPRFPEGPTVYAPKFAPLDAHRPTGASNSGVFTLTVAAAVDRGDVAPEEASRIARFIRSEVGSGRRQFGDFLILTRKKKPLDQYARALEVLQIPVEVSGAGAFGQSVEVTSLALLLRALADPQDAVSLIGVLRGPLFGLSDPALFSHQQAGGWFSIFSDATPKDENGARVVAALASLGAMFRLTRVLPTGAAMERILERTGYLALAATSPGGVEAGDLLHAVDRVRAVVESGFSLLDAAEALEDDAEESSEVESLPLEPGRPDVVRLMNLHKAKGLEAPVVFLADPCGGFEPRVDVRIIRDGTDARGYLLITRKVGEHGVERIAEPIGWPEHEAEERRYLDAEGGRLLYVAATRARDALVIGRWAKPGGGASRAWAAFDPHLTSVPELAAPLTVALPTPASVDSSAAAAANAMAACESAHTKAHRPSWTATSVTSEAPHIAKITAVAEPAPDDPTRVVAANTPSRRADAGAAWGTLIHGLLEHAMRHKSATRDDLRRLAMWMTVEEPQLRAVIDEALDTVQAVAAATFWKEARAASECHEEAPFSLKDKADPLPRVLSGTMDLVYRLGDAWQLIDYKTDADGATVDLLRQYEAQIRSYETAWSRLSGGSVTSRIVRARDNESASND